MQVSCMHCWVGSASAVHKARAAGGRSKVRRLTDARREAVHDGHDVDAKRPRQRDDVRELQRQIDKAFSTPNWANLGQSVWLMTVHKNRRLGSNAGCCELIQRGIRGTQVWQVC